MPLTPAFELDEAAMLAAIARERPALMYLAYPNNPTAKPFDERIVERVGGGVDRAWRRVGQERRGFRGICRPHHPSSRADRAVVEAGIDSRRAVALRASAVRRRQQGL